MNKTKVLLLAIFTTLTSLSVVFFSACSSNSKCSTALCLNGGTCSDGKCTCPSGYTGLRCQTAATSGISYKNNTFTPITITVNGTAKTIPVGLSATFTGTNGTAALGTATTSGSAKSLGVSAAAGFIGLPINWAIDNTFPVSDTLRVPLDVGATYFFLRMTNTSSRNIINYYVNYQFPYGEEYQDVTVPNNSVTYDLGYYLAYPNSNVQAQSTTTTTPKIDWRAVSLPFTSNQTATVTIN